jgi:hypothetical protein
VTEAEVVGAFATLGQAYLAGLQASFAIVSAYIVELYFFLGRAPFPLRVLAFLFFSATLAVGVYLAGVMAYGDGIAAALGVVHTLYRSRVADQPPARICTSLHLARDRPCCVLGVVLSDLLLSLANAH